MKAVIRQVTTVGEIILHEIQPGRYAIEVVGLDLKALICDTVRIGLKMSEDTPENTIPHWDLGIAQIQIGPMQGVEKLLNPEQFRVTDRKPVRIHDKEKDDGN